MPQYSIEGASLRIWCCCSGRSDNFIHKEYAVSAAFAVHAAPER